MVNFAGETTPNEAPITMKEEGDTLPSEFEVDDGNDGEVIFEGGELDGLKQTADGKLVKVEKKDAPATEKVEAKADATTTETPDPATLAAADGKAEGEKATAAETPATETQPEGEPVKTETPGAYQPTATKLKVYDKEVEVPAWAKPMMTSKENEEVLVRTLQKSEAFDVLKPRHEGVIRERDEARSHVQEHVERVNRLVQLRDNNLDLFLRQMGVKDEAIIRHATKLAKADDDTAEATALANQRRADDDAIRQEAADRAAEESRRANVESHIAMHRQVTEMVFATPEVATFKQRFESVHGQGSFENAFNQVGNLAYQAGEGYLHPQVVAQRVMQHYGAVLPQVTPTPAPVVTPPTNQQPQQTQSAPAHVAPAKRPMRPSTIPNYGHGTTTSPVKGRPKSLAEVEKAANEALNRT